MINYGNYRGIQFRAHTQSPGSLRCTKNSELDFTQQIAWWYKPTAYVSKMTEQAVSQVSLVEWMPIRRMLVQVTFSGADIPNVLLLFAKCNFSLLWWWECGQWEGIVGSYFRNVLFKFSGLITLSKKWITFRESGLFRWTSVYVVWQTSTVKWLMHKTHHSGTRFTCMQINTVLMEAGKAVLEASSNFEINAILAILMVKCSGMKKNWMYKV